MRIGSGDEQSSIIELQITADYFQIHLYDFTDDTMDVSDEWAENLINHRIGADPGQATLIGLGTCRTGKVPVTVEVLNQAPTDDDFANWDRVAEASIKVPSGVLIIKGPTALSQTAEELHLSPGTYRIRHHIAGQDTLSEDELTGNDHYRLLIWPEEPYSDPRALKP